MTASKKSKMSKTFISYAVGLECNGNNLVGVLVKAEYNRLSSGDVEIRAVSGRNGAPIRCRHVVLSAAEFDDRPRDPYDSIVEARWALNALGFTLMSEDTE